MILYEIEAAANYQIISQLVEEIQLLFEVKTPYYDDLEENSKITNFNVMNKQYNSLDAFIKELEAEAKAYESNAISSGGGSSRGKSFGGVKTDRLVTEITDSSIIKSNVSPVNFDDVCESRWSYNAINTLALRNVINGDGNGVFRPENDVTREEFVKMAVMAFSLKDEGAQSSFTDVSNADECFAKVKENGFSCCQLVFKPKKYTSEDAKIIKNAAKKMMSKLFHFLPASTIHTLSGTFMMIISLQV